MKTRSDFIDWYEKKWPGLVEYMEKNSSTYFGGPFLINVWKLTEDTIKFLDDKKTFSFEEDWDELKEYTKEWIEEYFSEEIIYSINRFLEPMKRYPSVFGDRPGIDYKWFEKNYKIREENFYTFYNLWEWVSKTKVEVKINNLDFIDKVDDIKITLEKFKSRNELLCQYNIGELNLTI